MDFDDIIKEQSQRLSWYSWLLCDVTVLTESTVQSPGVLLQTILRGITSWAYAKYGFEKTAKQRFTSICVEELGLAKPLANVLYRCKNGYDEMGTWPQEVTLALSSATDPFWIMSEKDSLNLSLVINVVALINLVVQRLQTQLPQGKDGQFQYAACFVGGEQIVDAIEHLRKRKVKGNQEGRWRNDDHEGHDG